jgi:DNA-binding transcriptional LysR family regulator
MDWDDFRYFLSVAQTGSLAGASRALGVNHTTVYRRILALEQKQSVRLFDRLGGAYALTAAGEEMQAAAEIIAEEVDGLTRRLSGRDLRLSGTIRVTTTDTLVARFLGPHLAAFNTAFPGIDLEIVLDTQHLNLSKREADIAIRPTDTPPENLVGRRVSDLAFAVYGSPDYLAAHAEKDNLMAHRWVGFDESLMHLAPAKWMVTNLDDPKIVLKANNFFALSSAAIAGMGLAWLPCFLADVEPELRRFAGLEPEIGSSLWLLTHADLRHTARVRAFLDYFYEVLSGEVELLEGRLPGAG